MAHFDLFPNTNVRNWKSSARFGGFILIFIALAAGILLTRPAPAAADAGAQPCARIQTAPTATPPAASGQSGPRTSPLIGILVLLAPLAFMVWKSRGAKEAKITAACCLPVIDENKRPFQIEEDEPAPNKSSVA